MDLQRPQRIGLFMAIAVAGSWSIAVALLAMGGAWPTPAGRAMAILFTVPPAVSALIVQGPILKRPLIEPLGLRLTLNRWLLVAWLAPVAIAGMTIAFSSLLPGVHVATTTAKFIEMNISRVPPKQVAHFRKMMASQAIHPALRFVLQGMVAGLTVSGFVSLGEELGFRGFLLKEVTGGFFRRSILIGVLWGLWLIPLGGYFHAGHPIEGAVLLFVWAIVLSPALVYVRVRSRTILAPIFFRGTLMAMIQLPLITTSGGDERFVSLQGVMGIAASAVIVLLFVLHDRFIAKQRVSARPRPGPAAGD